MSTDLTTQRRRGLTESGWSMYISNWSKYDNKVKRIQKDIEDTIRIYEQLQTKPDKTETIEKIYKIYDRLSKVIEDARDFLERQGHEDSQNKLVDLNAAYDFIVDKIQDVRTDYESCSMSSESLDTVVHMDRVKKEKSEKSHKTVKSRSLKSASSKAEKIKEFAILEGELLKEKARLEAKEILLKAKKKEAMLLSDARDLSSKRSSSHTSGTISEHSRFQRTQEYVADQNVILAQNDYYDTPLDLTMSRPQNIVSQDVASQNAAPQNVAPQMVTQQNLAQQNIMPQNLAQQNSTPQNLAPQNITPQNVMSPNIIPQNVMPQNSTPLNVMSQSFTPQTVLPYNASAQNFVPQNMQQNFAPNPGYTDVMKYMFRKDLLMNRLYKFDERAESYLSWKRTFKDVMDEMSVQPCEELDLIIKYLGSTSATQITHIRNSNAQDPSLGLTKAWGRLDLLFGSAEKIERSISEMLRKLPTVTLDSKDKLKFYAVSDAVQEVLSIKNNDKFANVLNYFDTPKGTNPILLKLPLMVRNKWRTQATAYKRTHDVLYPPFSVFATFVKDTAEMMNDPSFDYEDCDVQHVQRSRPREERKIFVRQTTLQGTRCPIHRANNHHLKDCLAFAGMTCSRKRELLKEHGLCFRCLGEKHRSKDCRALVNCDTCKSKRHLTVMHDPNFRLSEQGHGGEEAPKQQPPLQEPKGIKIINKCTEMCDKTFHGRSCAKIVQVTIKHIDNLHEPKQIYAIIDEQSNKSIGSPMLFDMYDPNCNSNCFEMETCSGRVLTDGRVSHGFSVESLDRSFELKIPSLIECETIPNNRQEIPTPDVAAHFDHLSSLCDLIPPLNEQAEILLLLGRNALGALPIHEQIIGEMHEPFAQRIGLGWVIIGDVCLEGTHKSVTAMKTSIALEDRTQSLFTPCHNKVNISVPDFSSNDDSIFQINNNDQTPCMSIEDKNFVALMDKEMVKGENGNWIAPLPFKQNRPRLPNNRKQAEDRARCLDSSLKRDPLKRTHFLEFMDGLLKAGHAEPAPSLNPSEESWYLPLFGVYHPKKRDKIRGVFDASAKYQGHSLNSVLLTGPDLMNSLVGVLMRFRKEKVAIMADIGLMFYCFFVRPDHRRYLRFLWHEQNDLELPLVDYHMNVHVFGNSPSPAVATYGLRKTADIAERKYGSDMKAFVYRNFYVDDALSSHPNADEAKDLLTRTKSALQEFGNLRLHKISSNSQEVLSAFDNSELSKDLVHHELGGTLPTQRSLGMRWNLQSDHFVFHVDMKDRPYTRRGVLSSINSLFDPLGIVAPVVIEGKTILREAMTSGCDWDEPLSETFHKRWDLWRSSLQELENLKIQRTYGNMSVQEAVRRDLYIYSDASQTAIGAVAYIKLTDSSNHEHLGFVMGKAKLAPKHGHTIPRLELCGAVLATELYTIICNELDVTFQSVQFFTDSRVVLAYILNESKRFYAYVANRVECIRLRTNPSDWNYVPSNLNPADEATRSLPAYNMENSMWLNGPPQLCTEKCLVEDFPVSDSDLEVRSLKTQVEVKRQSLDSSRFEHFSSWDSLIRAVAILKHVSAGKCEKSDSIWHVCDISRSPDIKNEAKHHIIATVQKESYYKEIDALENNKSIPRDSPIRDLHPFIDSEGMLRVGGRLTNASIGLTQKNPLIIPKQHHIAKLIVTHYHAEVIHQGRRYTEGALCTAGYWIVGCRRVINSVIHSCVICRKSRGKREVPLMADLPSDRLDPAPPFTYIGVDVFGPWHVVTRKTRGGQANSKRWAVIFTCLVIRAVHIEIIEEMSTSSFINALRRFIALRGEVRLIRSDCGSNFIGAAKELNVNILHAGDHDVKEYLNKKGITWKFNAPHSSHMGGAWERAIGMARRILDSMLSDVQYKNLTHEVLVTLMAEVSAIINARPLGGISRDPLAPVPLSPSVLLTMKTNHTVDSFKMDDFSGKDLFTHQWRCVQQLANRFWKRWRMDYLPTLQTRRKWQDDSRNLCEGDVVLLRDKTEHRNSWPLGVIVRAVPDDDNRVRKIDVRVTPYNKVYSRPASEVVLLVPVNQ